jgi:putative oxygen-independent coproporphyrinogen III oxidase
MSLGLYVHLPFCRVHCTYCAFAVVTDITQQDRYTEALLKEIAGRDSQDCLSSTVVDSTYFGGGTPSRTSLENLFRVTAAIRENFTLTPDAEFSMESNPEDITPESVTTWCELGVNRISVGVQSFHDAELFPLGRVHGSKLARDAVATVVESGVRANLDLILGLPGQTRESFVETIETAIGSGVGHISLYMLDLEENSPLSTQVGRGRATLPDDDLVAELYVEAIDRLENAGLHQYEISNFARTGEECRHNLRYWSRGEYLGFGLGAHSFVGDRRFANTRDIRRYIELSPVASDFSEELTDLETKRETIFLRLRQPAGIDYAVLERLCGPEGLEWIDRGLKDGWLRRSGGSVAFTPAGFLLSNDYISQLF